MTWIVATPVPFGYAAGISDIQVSWKDGRTLDCIQKIHRVGPSLALGFAGSVKIGFTMCESIVSFLDPPPPPGNDWDPPWVAKNWQPEAVKVFQSAESAERELRCELLLLGAHPNKDIGGTDWARPYVFRMRWPDFTPEEYGLGVVSIGSGTAVPSYQKKLEEIVADETRFPYLQAQMLGPHGYGDAVLTAVERAIEDDPQAGISRHLHLAIVSRQFVGIRPNDRIYYSTPPREFTMPKVARTWDEYRLMVGASAAESVA